MASPITWKNVASPRFGAALEGIGRAGAGINAAVTGIGDALTGYADDKEAADTDAFITELNALGSDEERQAMIAQAKDGFLNMGDINEAQLAAQQNDRDVTRFNQGTELHNSNLATDKLQQEDLVTAAAHRAKTNPLQIKSLENDLVYDKDANIRLNKATELAVNADTRAGVAADENTAAAKRAAKLFDQQQEAYADGSYLRGLKQEIEETSAGNTLDQQGKDLTAKEQLVTLDSLDANSQEQLDKLNEFLRSNPGKGIKNEGLKEFQARLLDNTQVDVEGALLGITGKASLGEMSPAEFTGSVQQKLKNELNSRVRKAFPYASKQTIKAKVDAAISNVPGLSSAFGIGAKQAATESELLNIKGDTVVGKAKARSEALVSMNENPQGYLLNSVAGKFSSQGRNEFVDPIKLNQVVSGTFDKVVKEFSKNGAVLSETNRNALNLAMRDMFGRLEVDQDYLSKNNYVLPGVDDSTDVSNLDIRDILTALTQHIPADSAEVTGDAFDKVLKKHIKNLN